MSVNIKLSSKYLMSGILLLLLSALLPLCLYAQSDNLNEALEKNQYLLEGDPGYAEFMAAVTNLNNDSSMYYAEALRQVAETSDYPLAKIYYYKILSSIYLDRDFKDMAIDASRHQAELAQRYNYPLQLFDAYDKIANTLILQNKIAEAREVFSTFEERLKEMVIKVDSNTERQMQLQKDRSKSSQVVLVLFFLMIMGLLVSIIYSAVSHNRSLQTVSDMKTMFVQNMSHEIRTPLNAIVGFSQLLALPDGVVTEEEKKKYGEYIMTNSNMLTMLVDDILNLSDVESGNYRVTFARTQCNAPVEAAMKTSELRVPAGVNMYYTTEVDDNFTIVSDAHRIQQVLVNYITNACKHTTEGEIHIHCSLKERPGYLTYSVTDTGKGVPEDKAEEIFERFTKLNTFAQGTGLGLSICRMIATKLNGVVKLDTSYKRGARFIFQIPLKHE
ncbi:MAG: HAMP domain-containing histidine kinase [Bacteroidaceae bacterium]|nr:HAMP domain-containing histidine kinase [Bacteroidaceae bacterium]